MSEKAYTQKLENALAQLLQPMKGIPFKVVIKSLSQKELIPLDRGDVNDKKLIKKIEKAIEACGQALKSKPIKRPRPNEVGNDVEEYVMKALDEVGLKAERPRTKTGKLKTTGYPDILITDAAGRPTYVECKIAAAGKEPSSFRSFYVSPSDEFKVVYDARHLLICFEMTSKKIPNRDLSEYKPTSYKLVDLSGLDCDMKHEFNADNKRLYDTKMVVSEGKL